MTTRPARPGFYGKLPALGDFVSRRLPRQFIEPWDQWLQSAIAASREQLGNDWLDIYLTSPIWRFGLGAGVCGTGAWAGVLMPSVDKVGRYYPLTLAVPVPEAQSLPFLFHQGCAWFETLETLALSGLEDDFDLDEFDGKLERLNLPAFMDDSSGMMPARNSGAGRFALHFEVESLHQGADAFVGLSGCLLDRFLPAHSLWGTSGSEHIEASLLVLEGLPPIDAFAALMTGNWEQRGWAVRTRRLPNLAAPVSAAPTEAGEPQVGPRRWLSHGISVVGKRRKINEDAFVERPDVGLWAVADGMGGHQAGDVASRAIVDALAALPATGDLEEAVTNVESALQRVNADLLQLAAQSPGEIIGSTVVVLLVADHQGACVWAGDSRLYRYRQGQLEQMTRDHSLADELSFFEMVRDEKPGPQEHCNIITRAVGADSVLAVDILRFAITEGDVFLLCSDGLDKEAGPMEIEEILRAGDCKERAESLIALAMDRGARDNVTVIVVQSP